MKHPPEMQIRYDGDPHLYCIRVMDYGVCVEIKPTNGYNLRFEFKGDERSGDIGGTVHNGKSWNHEAVEKMIKFYWQEVEHLQRFSK